METTKTSTIDQSILAFLHPSFMDELRFGIFKDSMSIHGSYRMNLRQPSRQPEHSREYQVGDPIRLIDWKAFAKHDQLIIREVQDEASANVVIAVDTSHTMNWPDEGVKRPSSIVQKLECAFRVGMALAYAHLKVGDVVKVVYTNGDTPKMLFRPRSSTDVVAAFDRVSSKGFTDEIIFEDCTNAPTWPQKSDKTYFISDFLYLRVPVRAFSIPSHSKDVHVYHLLSSLEINTKWIESDSFYHDAIGHSPKEYQGKTLNQGEGYNKCLDDWKDSIKKVLKKTGTTYNEITEHTSVHSFLHTITS